MTLTLPNLSAGYRPLKHSTLRERGAGGGDYCALPLECSANSSANAKNQTTILKNAMQTRIPEAPVTAYLQVKEKLKGEKRDAKREGQQRVGGS